MERIAKVDLDILVHRSRSLFFLKFSCVAASFVDGLPFQMRPAF